jgi:hypothetical protein
MAYDVYLSLPIVSFDGNADDLDTAITGEWTLLDSDGNEVAILGTKIEEVEAADTDAERVS